MLTLLRALAGRSPTFDVAAVAPSAIERALQLGLGPVLCHLADSAEWGRRYAERIRASELTAHALAAALLLQTYRTHGFWPSLPT